MSEKPEKPKPKRPPRLSQNEQSARFIKTARKLATDESGKAFDKSVAEILPTKR